MEIEALLENYHSEATKNAKDIGAIKAEVTKIGEKVEAMKAIGTGISTSRCWEDTAVGAEYSKAFKAYLRKGQAAAGGHALRELEIRAGLSVGSDPDGGFSALPTYSDQIDEVLRDQSPMRDHCRNVKITGAAFVELIDASDVGSGWVGEQDGRSETSSPQLMERENSCQ